MPKSRSRTKEFEDLVHRPAQEFDPEDDAQLLNNGYPEDEDSTSSSEDNDAFTGREHYTAVGKSNLRNHLPESLGPQYEGSRVSRNGVRDVDEETDPFALANGAGESDDDRVDHHGSSDDSAAISEDDEGSEDSNIEENGHVFPTKDQEDREALKRLLNDDTRTVAATIAQANKDDAAKGIAVKQQRSTFDGLLNSRIRLQAGLVAVNSMSATDRPKDGTTANDPVTSALNAAQMLWSNLEDLRVSIHNARTGDKRKRPQLDSSSATSTVWNHMQGIEQSEVSKRRDNLAKWSLKTQPASIQTTRSKLNPNVGPSTILDSVDGQIANMDRLVKRTRVPRSCAPVQAAAHVLEAAEVYDDADFYGLLLKELLEQRNAAAASNIQFDRIAEQWQAARDVKTKKVVDTKASKGRKLRYNIHEKLQNFMAPENRCQWEDRQMDELFGSLLGRQSGLEEQDIAGDNAVEGVDQEEQTLRLFRS